MKKRIITPDGTYRLTAYSENYESGGICIYFVRQGDNHTKQQRTDASAGQVTSATAWDFVAAQIGGVVEDVEPEGMNITADGTRNTAPFETGREP